MPPENPVRVLKSCGLPLRLLRFSPPNGPKFTCAVSIAGASTRHTQSIDSRSRIVGSDNRKVRPVLLRGVSTSTDWAVSKAPRRDVFRLCQRQPVLHRGTVQGCLRSASPPFTH